MSSLDKEIKIVMLKGERGTDGQDGKSSYELAIENELFSGTLEQWINTFATPENYITRGEFQKVTQAQYDALKQAGQLTPNCYYLIIDDTTYDDIEQAIENLDNALSPMQTDITNLKSRTTNLEAKVYKIVGNEEAGYNTGSLSNDGNNINLFQGFANSSFTYEETGYISIKKDEIKLEFTTLDNGIETAQKSFSFKANGTLVIEDVVNNKTTTLSLIDQFTPTTNGITIFNGKANMIKQGLYEITFNMNDQIDKHAIINVEGTTDKDYYVGINNSTLVSSNTLVTVSSSMSGNVRIYEIGVTGGTITNCKSIMIYSE